jgi:hypothetical protein
MFPPRIPFPYVQFLFLVVLCFGEIIRGYIIEQLNFLRPLQSSQAEASPTETRLFGLFVGLPRILNNTIL